MNPVSLAEETQHASATIFLVAARVDRALEGRRLAATLVGETERDHALARRGAHPDVIELAPPEGKEQVGIEQVRQAIRALQFAPVQGGRRVCLIPRAERMTPEAANALLKTLEEPPREVAFVLLANHTADLLPTILSRSRIVRLPSAERSSDAERLRDRGYSDDEVRYLLTVADREGEIDRFAEERIDLDTLRAAAESQARSLDPSELVVAAVAGESILRRAALDEVLRRAARRDAPLLTEGVRTLATQGREGLFAFLQDLLTLCHETARAETRGDAAEPRCPGAACIAIDHAHRALTVHGPTEAILLALFLSIGRDSDGR